MGQGCPLLLSHSSSEGINADPKGLATVFPEGNTCQRVYLAVEMKNLLQLGLFDD